MLFLSISVLGCQSSDDDSYSYNELNIPSLRDYETIEDFYMLNGTIYIRTNTNNLHYLNDYNDEERQDSFYTSQALNSGFTRELGGRLDQLEQLGSSIYSLSSTGVLVRKFMSHDRNTLTVFNDYIDLSMDERIVEFGAIEDGFDNPTVFVLTNKHRVFTFGDNKGGNLMDGTTVTPNCFIDITNNIPLFVDEHVIDVGARYVVTNQGRILTSDVYIKRTEKTFLGAICLNSISNLTHTFNKL